MVIKKGELDAAREIFERMTLLNLQPKRMKAFFKKYLEFEQTHGEPHKADQVIYPHLEKLK
jgi:rRNA biogenesis protein RRP5